MSIFYLYVTDSVENADALLTTWDNQEQQGGAARDDSYGKQHQMPALSSLLDQEVDR